MLYNQPYRDLIQNANTWLVTVVATAHRDAAERARTNERRRCAVSAPRSWRENAPSLPRTNESVAMMMTLSHSASRSQCAPKRQRQPSTHRRGRAAIVTTATQKKETTTTSTSSVYDRANLAMMTAMTTLTSAGAARADVKEVEDFLIAFWKFRTADTASFILLTVLPILGPYAVFSYFIKKKTATQLEKLEAGGWLEFMKERELDATKLQLPQLNAFVKAADLGVLDDAMVREFVRKLKLSEQWKKSTIAIEDNRAEEAKKRARAEAILEAKMAREKDQAVN